MTRGGAWVLPAVLLALVGTWAGWITLGGLAFLPRHTAARDVPYSLQAAVPAQPFNRAMTDAVNLIAPDAHVAHRALGAGRLPLWNHDILCGSPHAANPLTGTFYPPNLLLAWLQPLDFLLVNAALHVLLAGILGYVFLLAAGLRPAAAQLGALGFALSGWASAHLHNTMAVAVLTWLPLGLAGIEWVLAGKPKRGVLALAASIALQWLAGFAVLAAFGTLALGVYSGVSLLAVRGVPGRRRARLAGVLLGAAVLGVLLASGQLLLTLDMIGRSGRTGSPRDALLEQTFDPGVLAGLALPRWLGDAHEKPVTEPPSDPDSNPDHASRVLAARLLLGRGTPAQVPGIDNFGERTVYAGAPVLLLALAGLFSLRRRAAVALLATAALATAFALGALPPGPVLRALGLDVGAPARAVAILAFAVPALAAFGLDRLLDPELPSRSAWIALRLFGFVLGSAALATALFALANPSGALEAAIGGLHAIHAEAALGAGTNLPLAEQASALRPAFERLRTDLLCFAGFALATWIALEWGRARARKQAEPARVLRLAGCVVLALAAIDLGAFFLQVIRPVLRERLYEKTPAIAFLEAHASEGRVLRAAPDAAVARGDADVLLQPNVSLVHAVHDAQGYRELVPARLLRLMEGAAAFPAHWSDFPMGFSGIVPGAKHTPAPDLLAARWLIASAPLERASEAFAAAGLARVFPPAAESRPAGAPGDLLVYENARALPLAHVVHEATVLGDDEAIAALRDGTSDPRRRVILFEMPKDAAGTPAGEPAPGETATVRFEPDAIWIDATLSSPGFVVVSECWDPGWRARQWHGPFQEDRGGKLDVVRADAAFMAVWLPQGRHTIEFSYWPAALTWGIALGGAAALALLAVLVWPRRRTAAPAAEAAP